MLGSDVEARHGIHAVDGFGALHQPGVLHPRLVGPVDDGNPTDGPAGEVGEQSRLVPAHDELAHRVLPLLSVLLVLPPHGTPAVPRDRRATSWTGSFEQRLHVRPAVGRRRHDLDLVPLHLRDRRDLSPRGARIRHRPARSMCQMVAAGSSGESPTWRPASSRTSRNRRTKGWRWASTPSACCRESSTSCVRRASPRSSANGRAPGSTVRWSSFRVRVGAQCPCYPDSVTHVHAIEPSDTARKLASKRLAAATVPVERSGLDGQTGLGR